MTYIAIGYILWILSTLDNSKFGKKVAMACHLYLVGRWGLLL